jgi:hypothetical protein
VQQKDVEGVTVDPFTAVQQPAQRYEFGVDRHPTGVFDRVAGTHLVGNGTDAAHSSRDVRGFRIRAAAEERLEEARGLVDVQLDAVHRAVAQGDVQRTFSFDAGQRSDGERADFRIHSSFLSAVNLATLNVENTRSTSSPDMPSRRKRGIKAAVFGVAAGPKHP